MLLVTTVHFVTKIISTLGIWKINIENNVKHDMFLCAQNLAKSYK